MNTNSKSDINPKLEKHQRLRTLCRVLIVLAAVVLVAELSARFVLGLGDPPLSMTDPDIEYLFKPSSEYRRFGNRIAFNAFSMRSDPLEAKKTDSRQRRVMFLGDSVINGGNQTDQAELATEILRDRLASILNAPVVVGNISAGSWGPGNQLAYVKKYGFFDADVVVIVLSSHDESDYPTFKPTVGVLPSFPDRSPWLAVKELATRYIYGYVRKILFKRAQKPDDDPPSQQTIDKSLNAVRQIVQLARDTDADVLIAQHLEKSEIADAKLPGHAAIQELAKSMGIETIQLGPAFARSLDQGVNPYRDKIHPNAQGQQLIAKTLFDPLLFALTAAPTVTGEDD